MGVSAALVLWAFPWLSQGLASRASPVGSQPQKGPGEAPGGFVHLSNSSLFGGGKGPERAGDVPKDTQQPGVCPLTLRTKAMEEGQMRESVW